MATRSATIDEPGDRDVKYLAGIDKCLDEIASIRREMKKKDAEIRRLEVSTRRKLDQIRSSFHVQKAV